MSKLRLLLGLLSLAAVGSLSFFAELDASPAPQSTSPGGIVAFRLLSSSDGQTVSPFQEISWKVVLKVSPNDNMGLALYALDFVQDESNPAKFNIPRGFDPIPALQCFDQPAGFTNPAKRLDLTGFGGIGTGEFGAQNRSQLGGAQNTFGKVGPCFGQSTVICMGQDVDVDAGIGQNPNGIIAAEGAFRAPIVPGTYTFRIENMIANTLETVAVAPSASKTNAASIRNLNDTITFTVQ